MTVQEALAGYNRVKVAEGYVLGFILNNRVYYVLRNELCEKWVKLDTGSNGQKKLRFRLDQWERAKFLNKDAQYLCDADKLENKQYGKNRGDAFETLIAEHLTGERNHKKTGGSFRTNGDITLDGKQVEIKLDNGSIAELRTIFGAA